MRTLFQICVEGNTGSTGRIAEGLGVYVQDQGWNSYIANGRFTRPSKSNLIRIGSDWEVFLHGLKTRFFDKHALGSINATKQLIQQIAIIKPDIILLHHLHGYYINIEILFDFLKTSNVPVVWIFHDCWTLTGHCAYFDLVGCEKWKIECHNCPQKKEYPASLIFDRSKDNFHLKKKLFTSINKMTIVSVSKWLESIVKQSFMAEIPRRMIYNGVDVNLFNPQIYDINIRDKYEIGNRFMILGVASPWSQRKGFSDFIELSKMLSKDEVIVLVGLGLKQLKNLPHNIIGLSRTENQSQLKDLYATADIFLNLSVEETFGLTTAEALACGTPAAVYNATACPEIVDENTGFVVDSKDYEGLLQSVKRVKELGKDYYSSACRSRAVSLFNKEDRFEEYFYLFKDILNEDN